MEKDHEIDQKAPQGVPTIAGATEVGKEPQPEKVEEAPKEEKKEEKKELDTHIFALRTTANREDQVMDFLVSNIKNKKLLVYMVIRPHGMRGYIFMEAIDVITS